MAHTHAVITVVDPRMQHGVRHGEVVIEGMARVLFAGFVKSCRMAGQWADTIEDAVDDPYNPIVDGVVLPLNLN